MRTFLDAANRLAKWRRHYANWQLGASKEGTQEYYAVADHREQSFLMRAEINALTRIILESKLVTIHGKLITEEKLNEIMMEEYDYLADAIAQSNPGMTATDVGLDIKLPEARDTLSKWDG